MFNEELEKAILYYLIFEKENFLLDEDDFVDERNKKIIKAINELKAEKKEISILSISNKIKANQKQVLNYLSNLGDYVLLSSSENIYNELIQLSKKRKIFELLKSKANEISECEDIDILSQDLIKQVNQIQRKDEKEKSFSEQLIETINQIEHDTVSEKDYSLYTGITDLDNIICGLHNEELTIIGARPGVGKTTFALQIAEHIAKKGVETAFISLEMSEKQIIQKMIAKKTRINTYKMRLGTLEEKDFEIISEKMGDLIELPMHLITNARTIQQIENIARKLKNKNNLGLMIIDYIQLIKNKGKFNNREQEVADITRTLKLLSLELKIPIIGLCQLNRNATRQEPMLSDLRESGAIEQDADNVMFLYQESENENYMVDITLKIAKQRAGEIGKVSLKFNKAISEFKGVIKC